MKESTSDLINRLRSGRKAPAQQQTLNEWTNLSPKDTFKKFYEEKQTCYECGYSGAKTEKHPGSFKNWRKPTEAESHTEFEREVPKTAHLGTLWNTKEEFADHVAKSPVEQISHKVHQNMSYASHHDTIDDLKDLTSTYRFPRDVDSITRGYHEHASMPTPIVLKHTLDGEDKPKYRIMSGNTRMAAAEIHGVPRHATVLDVTDHLKRTGKRF